MSNPEFNNKDLYVRIVKYFIEHIIESEALHDSDKSDVIALYIPPEYVPKSNIWNMIYYGIATTGTFLLARHRGDGIAYGTFIPLSMKLYEGLSDEFAFNRYKKLIDNFVVTIREQRDFSEKLMQLIRVQDTVIDIARMNHVKDHLVYYKIMYLRQFTQKLEDNVYYSINVLQSMIFEVCALCKIEQYLPEMLENLNLIDIIINNVCGMKSIFVDLISSLLKCVSIGLMVNYSNTPFEFHKLADELIPRYLLHTKSSLKKLKADYVQAMIIFNTRTPFPHVGNVGELRYFPTISYVDDLKISYLMTSTIQQNFQVTSFENVHLQSDILHLLREHIENNVEMIEFNNLISEGKKFHELAYYEFKMYSLKMKIRFQDRLIKSLRLSLKYDQPNM